ncbi:hypothetical protein AJ80_08908 [Polytolypa hystricis UAMH7299]|uniref:Cell pattern formation-associated protein stuA n=1 Tax=Polytolypa hystricis (strain UAMH7299) TaxID=1447883 RepID=A0A2B7WZA8_POLH7|nr:hypothetical protein AJ80_08908 [Polytolypa hystricis UAMH7299]
MANSTAEGKIYSATYSSVPVYEFKVGSDNVMRRRADDWINATHILKVAGLDKPARTRILEREVQKGVHEKVQGGYGKYQGTWIPLEEGRALAERNGVLPKLRIIFDYASGDKTPPPAPKHTTAASSRPKAPKAAAVNRRVLPDESSFTTINARSTAPSFSQEQFAHVNHSFNDNESVAQSIEETSSMVADDDMVPMSQHSTHSRKRKRGMNEAALSIIEQHHIIYGDQLLDYFMTVGDDPATGRMKPPEPPEPFQVDRPIDDQGNTALHWACSMGDIGIVKDLLSRGANVGALSSHDETPLVRAILFTNNYEKGTMPELAHLLQDTITFRDWYGATVFNHLAATTKSKGKWKSSRYYCEVLIDKLRELLPPHEISRLLSSQDSNGDTAALAASRNGCYKLARMILEHCSPEAGDIPNKHRETANELLQTLSRRQRDHPPPPSSVTHHSVHESEHPTFHSVQENGPLSQPSHTPDSTATLLAKIGSIMEDANRKLALAYGDRKLESRTLEDITNPQGLYEHVESDRENIRKQTADLARNEEGAPPLEAQIARLNKVKHDYESLLEQTQKLALLKRFKAAACEPDPMSPPQPNPNRDLTAVYRAARDLYAVQQERRQALRDLVQQRADAGVSTKLDVHRKLVSLATGLKEDELDPMSAELADTLEFERAAEKKAGTGNGGGGAQMLLPGDENGEEDVDDGDDDERGLLDVELPGHHRRADMVASMAMSERVIPG